MTSLEFNKNKDLLKDSKLFMSVLAENLKDLMGLDISIENPQMGEFPLSRIVEEFFGTSLVVTITDSKGTNGIFAANQDAMDAVNSKGDEGMIRMLFNTALLNTANSSQAVGGIVEIGEEEASKAYWSNQNGDMKVLVVAYDLKGLTSGQVIAAFPTEVYLNSESVVGQGQVVNLDDEEEAVQPQGGYQQPTEPMQPPQPMQQPQPMQPPMQRAAQQAPANAVGVSKMALPNLDEGEENAQSRAMNYIDDIPMQITVEVGRSRMSVREILGINKGSIIPLDRMADDPVDVLVNGKLFAKGEIVVIDDFFGVRLVEVIQNSNFKLANKSRM